jgi:hypothetical protein
VLVLLILVGVAIHPAVTTNADLLLGLMFVFGVLTAYRIATSGLRNTAPKAGSQESREAEAEPRSTAETVVDGAS